jgi:alpha-tubulin suppressor-like RCC1 family protein
LASAFNRAHHTQAAPLQIRLEIRRLQVRLKSGLFFADKLTMINTARIQYQNQSGLAKFCFAIGLLLGYALLSSCSFSGKITSLNQSASGGSVATVTVSVSDKIVPEYGVAAVPVQLSKALTTPLTFTYYTQDSTAISGQDYLAVSGTATIAAGQTSTTIFVSVFDNVTKASNKKFFFNLSNISLSDVALQSSSLIEIQDDDYTPMNLGVSGKISTGNNHTCALSTNGGVKCWGLNSSGQLGDGSTTTRTTAVDVTGLTSGVAVISGGSSHTCALTTSGGLKCWGVNLNGQLGDGSTTTRTTAVDVTGLTSGVAAVSTRNNHSCALTAGGGVKCWGLNANGQLGDGSTTTRTTAVDVTGLTSGVAVISAGSAHTCALTTGGGVKCWGMNTNGQLGDGTTTQRTTAVDVTGLTSGVAAISGGSSHTCAITTGGGLKCWGLNTDGQLGDGTTTQSTTAVDVTGLTSGVATVSSGNANTCAIITGGGLKCWGMNTNGQLGDGSTTTRTTAVDVTGLTSGVAAVSARLSHTCALTTSGEAKCWGRNNNGQLGDGTIAFRLTAVDVVGLTSGVAVVSSGERYTCALTTGGGVKCWGLNTSGQLGDGTTTQRSTAVDMTGLSSGVAAISLGSSHTCALTTLGGVKCSGSNSFGQLGDGTTTDRTIGGDVTGLTSGVAAISAGRFHSCALTTGGGVKCWGSNGGQLGDGTTTQRTTAVDVTGLTSGVAAISSGGNQTCAITTGGGMKCWGVNSSGQLGDGTTTTRTTAVDVTGLTGGVVALSAGFSHTCALTTVGGVKCWGSNANGQLGDGTTTQRTTAVDVTGLTSGVAAISSGNSHTCALTTVGGVKCWGSNANGQLGDGTTTQRTTAVDVTGLTGGVSAVSAGFSHSCALTTAGGVKCWGENSSNELGSSYNNLTPQNVIQP